MTSAARLLLSVSAFALIPLASAQNTQQQSFVSGGRVQINLEAGDYNIRPSAGKNLRVTWFGDSVEHPQVKVRINVKGSSAEVRVENTPHDNFHANIEVPAKTDLYVRLTAGNLTLTGITGSKDIESRAGNVNIDVGNPNDYARVDASVTAGNLDAPAFKTARDGIFRSFRWTGPGAFSLHAHLLTGNLTLENK